MLHVYCEGNRRGHTEALFVRDVLNPYLESQGKTRAIPVPSRGLEPFSRVLADVRDILRIPHTRVTTLIDYYGTPADYPGLPHRSPPPGNRAAVYDEIHRLETALANAVDNPRFIPHYALHEFEALAFASPEAIAEQRKRLGGSSILADAQRMLAEAKGNPEWVNDNVATSPSHRLGSLWPVGANGKTTYQKTVDSIGIVRRIPFNDLLARCQHFQRWVAKL